MKHRRRSLVPVLLAAAALFQAPSCGDAAAGRRTLVLTGSSTVAPLAAEIGKRFEARHPGVRVDVQTGGSSRGVADVRRGVADIGTVSRALAASEHDLHAFTIARDGVCLIAHRTNPVTSFDEAQVVGIYTGKITNWKAVGSADGPITVVHKAEGRSTLELFLHHFGLRNSEVQPDVVIGDNEQGIKTVAGNPWAIGYVSIGAAEYDATHGVAIKLLPVGGVAASVANVRNGSFPISRPLNLVTRTLPEGLVRQFIDFARSPAVEDLVRSLYFVPIAKK